MTIELKQQIDNVTCVSACAAMLTGKSVELVVDEFHDHYMRYQTDLDDYLKENGVIAERTEHRSRLEPGNVYVLTVPALNSIGKFHQILADTRGELKIYDPSRNGRQRYAADEQCEPGETPIMAWIVDYVITHAPVIGIIGGDNGSRS